MPDRNGYIPGVPCWVDTNQPDPTAAEGFYAGLFGWELEDGMPEGSGSHYFMARIRGRDVAAISSVPEGAPPMAVWNTYIWVDDADATAQKVADSGGAVLAEPFDVMGAGRMAVLADTEGAAFCAWQARDHRGSAVVNEHGSVNFNGLACRDVAAAERFYGAVFGWKHLPLASGSMWTLPGYGDHLEEATPGLREQVTAMGAPDGFIDVVAQLNPIPAGDTDTHPHWSVTFGTDDVDATAATASQLGGTIVEAPHDAPWVKTAVIEDPQGARFIASQFVAENAVAEPAPA
jgi:predicted enzyme related to lactoylglutathione lyase